MVINILLPLLIITLRIVVYLLKSKDGVIEKFVLQKNEVENRFNKKIKVLRSDRSGEYE